MSSTAPISIPISPMRQNLGRSTSILLALPPPTRSNTSVTKQVYQLLPTSPRFKLASESVVLALSRDADSFLALPCPHFFHFNKSGSQFDTTATAPKRT